MRTRALRLSCACLRVCRVRLRSVGSPLVCVRRYIALGSSLLSVCGACAIIFSALRFKELSKRFFAIRLIFFLALTDCMAAVLHILGATLDIQLLLHQIPRPPVICNVQAAGLLYFNLASMLWTSCFAFTLYRDVVPSHRRHALRKYELYFHALCWPLPAVLTGVCTSLSGGSFGSSCVFGLGNLRQYYFLCFYGPLLAAFAFNLLTYTAVLSHSRERRVSRITSLYLLGFTVVWLPSLIVRLQTLLSPAHTPWSLTSGLREASLQSGGVTIHHGGVSHHHAGSLIHDGGCQRGRWSQGEGLVER